MKVSIVVEYCPAFGSQIRYHGFPIDRGFFTVRTFRSRWNISNLPSDSYPFFCNFLRFAHFADTHISKPYFEPSSTGSVSCVVFSKGEAHRVFLRSLFFDSYYLWNAFSMKSIQMKHFKPFVH